MNFHKRLIDVIFCSGFTFLAISFSNRSCHPPAIHSLVPFIHLTLMPIQCGVLMLWRGCWEVNQCCCVRSVIEVVIIIHVADLARVIWANSAWHLLLVVMSANSTWKVMVVCCCWSSDVEFALQPKDSSTMGPHFWGVWVCSRVNRC